MLNDYYFKSKKIDGFRKKKIYIYRLVRIRFIRKIFKKKTSILVRLQGKPNIFWEEILTYRWSLDDWCLIYGDLLDDWDISIITLHVI